MTEMSLTVFDMAVLFVVGVSALLALARGMVRETLSLVAWIVAALIAFAAFQQVRPAIGDYIANEWIADAAALIVVFIAPMVCLKIIALLIAEALPGGLFGLTDRFLGTGYGLARGALLVSAAYIGLSTINLPENHPAWIQDAQLLPYVRDGAEVLADGAVTLADWMPEDILSAETWQALRGDALSPSPASAEPLLNETLPDHETLSDTVDKVPERTVPELESVDNR
ncbi:MAG: CvpA family protein [Geminicoccales bacterium]